MRGKKVKPSCIWPRSGSWEQMLQLHCPWNAFGWFSCTFACISTPHSARHPLFWLLHALYPLCGVRFCPYFGIWDTIKCNGTSCNKSDIDPHTCRRQFIYIDRYTYIYNIYKKALDFFVVCAAVLGDLEPRCEERSNKDERKTRQKELALAGEKNEFEAI